MSNQHSKQHKLAKKRNADPRREVAKTLQQATTTRPRITLLSICLVILGMFLLLVFMSWIQIRRIETASKTRADARMEKLEPIMTTTMKIESTTWRIRSWSSRNGHKLPKDLSDSWQENADAWGRPMTIEHEGAPVTGYKIASAGEDGQFETQDDVAIRFDMDHEQIERINTHGLPEMDAEMNAVMSAMGIDVQND